MLLVQQVKESTLELRRDTHNVKVHPYSESSFVFTAYRKAEAAPVCWLTARRRCGTDRRDGTDHNVDICAVLFYRVHLVILTCMTTTVTFHRSVGQDLVTTLCVCIHVIVKQSHVFFPLNVVIK